MLSLAACLVTAVCAGMVVHARPSVSVPRDKVRSLPAMLAEAGAGIAPAAFQLLRLALAGLVLVLVLALTGSLAVALPPAFAGWRAPLTLLLRRRIQRRRRLQEAWPDGLRELSASIAAGMSLPQAVSALVAGGPLAIREAFTRVPVLLDALGFRGALEAVRSAAGDPTTDRVIEVLLLAHERGGRVLPDLLADLADDASREAQLVERVTTAQLELRINARAVFVLPWLVLCALTARPGPFRDFYAEPAGAAVIALAAGLSGVGVLVVERLGRVPLEPRVLAGRGRS